jgi:hypothetical protein
MPPHDVPRHRHRQHAPEVGRLRRHASGRAAAGPRRRVHREHRHPGRGGMEGSPAAAGHDRLLRGQRRGAPPGGGTDRGAVGFRAGVGRGQQPGGRHHQRLRSPLPPGRRPLGGHDRRTLAPAAKRRAPPCTGGDGGHGGDGGRAGCERTLPGRLHPAGPRHHAESTRRWHRGIARTHRRGLRLSHQYQRCVDLRRHLRDRRRHRPHASQHRGALRRGAQLLAHRWRGLEDGAPPERAIRTGRIADLRRPAAHRAAPGRGQARALSLRLRGCSATGPRSSTARRACRPRRPRRS